MKTDNVTTTNEAVIALQKANKEPLNQNVKAAVQMSNKDGIQHIEQSAGLLFDQRFGTEAFANEKVTLAKAELDKAQARAESANQQHNDTAPVVTISTKQRDNETEEVEPRYISFWQWSFYNKALMVFLLLLLMISMGGSVVNTQVLLMTSQDSTLLLSPYKSWLIALVPMLLAMATKFLPNQLENDKSKIAYKRKLHAFTAYVGLFWLANFALLMDGFGSRGEYADVPFIAIALEVLRKLLTFSQILGELLAGLCIFTAIQDQFETFQPSALAKNPDRVLTKALIDECQPDVKHCKQAYLDTLACVDFIRVARPAFINTQLSALSVAKRRNQLINQQLEDL